MKTVKLIIEDKEVEVQISDEQIAELTKPKKVTGFERDEFYEPYYHVTDLDEIFYDINRNYGIDDEMYKVANYYTSIDLAKWCRRSDSLNRKMRRWAAEHNKEPIDWSKVKSEKYIIKYNGITKEFIVSWTDEYIINSVAYFSTRKLAEQAIKEFGDEIKWLAENRPKWF